MADIRILVKGAISGRDNPFFHNGRATAFKMFLAGEPVSKVPWKYFHPVFTQERLKAERRRAGAKPGAGGAGGSVMHAGSWTSAADPLLALTEALITKVSAMTMIERDEVAADAPLTSFNLDSLVSVELRNWIRRERGVELPLGAITQAESLRALAADLLLLRNKASVEKT